MARWFAVLVFVGLCAGATWLELERESPLTVEIGPALPVPDPEDWDNTLAHRYWNIDPEVAVRLNRDCEGLRVVSRAQAIFNGRRVTSWSPYLGSQDDELPGRHRAGFVHRIHESAYGLAGQMIRFRTTATCRRDGRTEQAAAVRDFWLPAVSCAGGPVPVFDVRGRVQVTDDDWETPETYRLRVGHLVRPGWQLDVPAGGRLLLGAPECNGFRVTLGPGRHYAGGYFVDGRGDAFATPNGEMTGDDHAGGFRFGATVEPFGFRCRGCGSVVPATFATRRISATRSVVRVRSGAVRARTDEGATVRVRAGQQISVVCRSQAPCSLVGLRLYQPDEPWKTAVSVGDRPFARRLVLRAGERPPGNLAAPARSRTRLIVLPAGGRVPEQLFVVWSRAVRGRPTVPVPEERDQQGVLLWQVSAAGGKTVWRLVYARRLHPYDYPVVDVGDMSGDGHPEVLYAGLRGSGNCGVWKLLITTTRGVEEVLRDFNCETQHQLSGGVLQLREAVGPCPFKVSGAHCYGGVRETSMRSDGHELVTVRTTVRCTLARLDPKRACQPRD